MGIRGKREVTVVISGKFDVNMLVDELIDLCDGRPEEFDGNLLSVCGSGDQRELASATLKFTRKDGVKSRPRPRIGTQFDVTDEDVPEPSFDQDPFGESTRGPNP